MAQEEESGRLIIVKDKVVFERDGGKKVKGYFSGIVVKDKKELQIVDIERAMRVYLGVKIGKERQG